MRRPLLTIAFTGVAVLLIALGGSHAVSVEHALGPSVELGPRPLFLVNDMTDSRLKRELLACADNRSTFSRSDFSMGHNGTTLQYPDHTKEAYEAAARMGAGIIECDVTFTKDKELVCRHSQNDLHATTNILATSLAAKCTTPFTPAHIDFTGDLLEAANAECRTSDITLAEFRMLRGRIDAVNPYARTVEEYLGEAGLMQVRANSGPISGTLLSHKESIKLFKELGVKMAPELTMPSVAMPFDGFTREAYAQKLIDEYKQAGISPRWVFAQSFNKRDILYWIAREPAFGRQAVFLDTANVVADLPTYAELLNFKAQGINIVAPPIFALLTTDANGKIIPSHYAIDAKRAGLDIITWTLENSGIPGDDDIHFFYQTFESAIQREGDTMRVLDALAKQVGILGIFSHVPATVTFYANCMGLK